MTDYNFAKNYENIKSWEVKNQKTFSSSSETSLDKLLNTIKSYPELVLILKKQKIF